MASSTALLVALLLLTLSCTAQPRPAQLPPDPPPTPDFGPNVLIFDPTTPAIQTRLDAIFATQERGEFNTNRYALLFKPGKYDLDVNVGFYTQVLGLGRSPDDVAITGAVRSTAAWRRGNATCNFWRSAENLSITPTIEGSANVWAVSQGTALRRVHIKGDLNLSDGGWSSGGFMADSAIDGRVDSGSQQQWLSRNSQWHHWRGGNWNMVFVGTVNPPQESWPDKSHTVVEKTPIIREKPYLFVDDAGRYFVMLPTLDARGSKGTTWHTGPSSGTPIPIEQFYLARSEHDTAASINAALAAGKHVILTPGIYHLEAGITISRPDTIMLGLGFPTLIPDTATPALIIADVDGVKLGGIILEAGPAESPTLLQVGEPGNSKPHATNPVFLYDLFCRAGGAAPGTATSLVTIHSSNVVGDNLWLWRADHGAGASWTGNKNRNGLVANGADITIYGLFVEHCQEYQTIWNGERGRVYFYQSEMPYDPPSQEAWSHDKIRGFASYKVADSVKTHEAWGLGVYCVFRAAPVIADSAFEVPASPGIKLHHLITVRLNGLPSSGIAHVLNSEGASVITTKTAKLD